MGGEWLVGCRKCDGSGAIFCRFDREFVVRDAWKGYGECWEFEVDVVVFSMVRARLVFDVFCAGEDANWKVRYVVGMELDSMRFDYDVDGAVSFYC